MVVVRAGGRRSVSSNCAVSDRSRGGEGVESDAERIKAAHAHLRRLANAWGEGEGERERERSKRDGRDHFSCNGGTLSSGGCQDRADDRGTEW